MANVKKVETRIRTIEVEDHLSLKQAASILSRSYFWLYSRIGKPGGPPHKRRGGQYIFPVEEFLAWSKQDNIP